MDFVSPALKTLKVTVGVIIKLYGVPDQVKEQLRFFTICNDNLQALVDRQKVIYLYDEDQKLLDPGRRERLDAVIMNALNDFIEFGNTLEKYAPKGTRNSTPLSRRSKWVAFKNDVMKDRGPRIQAHNATVLGELTHLDSLRIESNQPVPSLAPIDWLNTPTTFEIHHIGDGDSPLLDDMCKTQASSSVTLVDWATVASSIEVYSMDDLADHQQSKVQD